MTETIVSGCCSAIPSWHRKWFFTEASDDDGSLDDTLAVTLYTLFDENTFSGNNNDDFVTDGKVSFNNVPEGLTLKALRANDTTVLLLLEGNAIDHVFNNNIHNLEVTFNESAFTSVAEQVYNTTITDFSILYQTVFEVMGGTEGNGTYLQAGIFNNKPYCVNGDYLLGYRGCDVQWVIVDGGDPLNLERGYCPVYANEQGTEWPPVRTWNDANLRVYQHNSLIYSKASFSESDANDGSINNADTLVITCISPVLRATFSGENGSDFMTDDKIAFSGMPVGLAASAIRTSDTTLAMVINGKTSPDRDTHITLTFNDNAFEGITASAILSCSQELFLDFHNEFLVASSGGDFASLQEAIVSNKVKDGDILNLAAETFTENNLEVYKSLTIRGQGPGQTVIQAAETANSGAGLIFRADFDIQKKGKLVIENLTLKNGDYIYGGAIHIAYADLYIDNCELTDNYGYYYGGAVYVSEGTLYCTRSTFAGNRTEYSTTSTWYGGAAVCTKTGSSDKSSLIENCTFVNNTSLAYGGALNSYGEMEVRNSTFTGNSAYRGGAMYRYSFSLDIINTLVANNTATNAGPDLYGTINAYHSLIEDVTGATINGSDNITGVDPSLGALADNGGPTRTCAIPFASAAKDKGTNDGVPKLDQRGIIVFNDIKDIGAYEYNDKPSIIVYAEKLNLPAVMNDINETSYTIAAVNLTGNLKIETAGILELSLSSGGTLTGNQEIELTPDANGMVPVTPVFVKTMPAAHGTMVEKLFHSSANADTVAIPVTVSTISSPSGADESVMTTENTVITFANTNFTFSDEDGDVFAGILVVTNETNGDLEYDNVNVADETMCADVSQITFAPYANESGKPYATFTFRVMDNTGSVSTDTFTMTIGVNAVPVVQHPIPDGTANAGSAYTYAVPDNTFADAYQGDVLTYSATLADGNPLPGWLTFDPATATFNGTPDAIGDIDIKVTATDPELASVSDEFMLAIGANAVDNKPDKAVNIFPNPTDGLLNVTIPIAKGSMVMRVTNLTGETVMIRTLENASNPVDFSAFPAGVYIMKLSNGQKTVIRRIVVN